MVDCVLINSPDALFSDHYVADPKMPLGLLYIASFLQSQGASVKVIDCHAHEYTIESISYAVKKNRPRLVGLNVMTPNRKIVYKIVERIKSSVPKSVVIVGGPHVTCLPSDVVKHAPHIDGVVLGEGEYIVLGILNDIPHLKSFPGFCIREDVSVPSMTRLAPRIIELDALPFPAYDLIDAQRYLSVSPELYIAISRGCRLNCSFCCSRTLWDGRITFRSARSAIEEISYLLHEFRVRRFYFYDDNFVIWPELEDFCRSVRGLNIEWTAQAILNDLDIESIPLLASSGCYRVSFGLESGSVKIQKYIGKIVRPDARIKIAKLRDQGIIARAYFIIGFPDETIQDIAETTKYILDLRRFGLSDVIFFPARPYPGTRLFNDCIEIYGRENIEKTLNFEYVKDHHDESDPRIKMKLRKYNTIPAFNVNKYFSTYEIRKMIQAIYKVFYNYMGFLDASQSDLVAYLLTEAKR
jgi:anaerobic magnesium-protoporphyrin IX monomethyl ester cyclase